MQKTFLARIRVLGHFLVYVAVMRVTRLEIVVAARDTQCAGASLAPEVVGTGVVGKETGVQERRAC